MAAFAVFLLCKHTRICAALCLLYMLVEWNAVHLPNEEPKYLFQYYYLLMGAYAFLACYVLQQLSPSRQNTLFTILFLIGANQELWGFLLYTYDQPAVDYNFVGNCIIITFIIALWMTRNGEFESTSNFPDLYTRIRSYL